MCQNKNLERDSDSIRTQSALEIVCRKIARLWPGDLLSGVGVPISEQQSAPDVYRFTISAGKIDSRHLFNAR
jgi:hypothetical protein